WAAQGSEYIIWNYDHCLEAFKAVENNARKNPDDEFKNYHGFNGLLHVQDSPVDKFDISKDIFKVARDFGIPYNNDFSGVRQNGIGEFQFTMKDGKRFTLADGFLTDALKEVKIYPPKPIIHGCPHPPPSRALDDNVGKFVAVNVKSFAHVLNIIWDEKKNDKNVAIGVKYFCNGRIHNSYIAPKGEVIICGGALNSPQ
ncbi:35179_t:CDS:2, partial [Racocetra persica]